MPSSYLKLDGTKDNIIRNKIDQCFGIGGCRLGFIIDFLSKATLIGFMAGAAVIVSLQQLKSLLGIQHFTKKMAIVPVLSSVFEERREVINETERSPLKYSNSDILVC